MLEHATVPPRAGEAYALYINAPDADSIGRAGIRHPPPQAPLATHRGWNPRKAGHAEGELANNFGMRLPFARSRAERESTGDLRLSLEERYGNRGAYLAAVREACERLVSERLLLEEDIPGIMDEAAGQETGLPEG